MDKAWKKWERTVAESLSRWMSGGRCKTIVARQSLLGRMVERKYGDMAPHPDCPEKWRPAARWFMEKFHVDAKVRKAFRLPALLTGPAHPFWSWWGKLTHEAAMAGAKMRLMVLLAKPSNEHVLVFGRRERQWFDSLVGLKLSFPSMTLRRAYAEAGGDEEAVTLVQLEPMLKFLDPQALGCPGPEGVEDAAVGAAGPARPEDAGA